MIKNIVFDLGQVLLDYVTDGATRAFTEDTAILREVDLVVYKSSEWIMMDAGLMTEEEARKSFIAKCSSKEVAEVAINSFNNWDQYNLTMHPGMEALVKELKAAGYRIYVLSNLSARLGGERLKEHLTYADVFDGIFISALHRCLKPQPAIYEAFFKEYDLVPGECFFVDDLPKNIAGAKEAGMDGYVFDGNVQKLRTALQEMQTVGYYEEYADNYVKDTSNVDFHEPADRFLKYLPRDGYILDFGCGSGRDTKYFLEKGFQVTAVDGSEAMCKLATANTGIDAANMRFEDLDAKEIYDGIWACASILHLPKERLKNVFQKIYDALKTGGCLYVSFKYGDFEGMRNGRYFTDFTVNTIAKFLAEIPGLQPAEQWISKDVRPDRSEEEWLNIILKKKSRN